MKITIVGAGAHGSTLAYRIAAGDYADEVVHDRHRRGPAAGLALDMMHARALEGFRPPGWSARTGTTRPQARRCA